nr:hypothetical protein [Tanacetum cinerariifolium]
FWKTVKQVPNQNQTIRFMIDRKEITYIVDMFCSTLKLPVETPTQPFIEPSSLEYIQPFLKIISYQWIEPETRNENPETINNDDKEEKKYDKKDDDDNADHNDHSLVRKKVMGSVDTKNEKMQTLIPSPLDPVRHTYLHIRPFLRN